MFISGERKLDPSVHKIKIKVKPQCCPSDGLSSKHAKHIANDSSQHSCKEQDPPDVDGTDQISPGKKRKMNLGEVNGNMRNRKKEKLIKKDHKISTLVQSVYQEMGLSLINEDTQKMVEQPKQIYRNKGGSQITIEVDLPNLIKNGMNQSTISDFKEAIELKNHADRMKVCFLYVLLKISLPISTL